MTTHTPMTDCYECGSANSACKVETLPCGCKVHRRSVYINGSYQRDEYKDWTKHCPTHKQPAPKANPNLCPKCGTYCYGDCEASSTPQRRPSARYASVTTDYECEAGLDA